MAEEAMEEVVEAVAKEAAKVAVPEIHAIAAKEAVMKKAATAALCEIRHEKAMTTLEAVAMEAAKVAVRELRHGVAAHEASAWMYAADAMAEEARMADATAVAATWELVNAMRWRWRTTQGGGGGGGHRRAPCGEGGHSHDIGVRILDGICSLGEQPTVI
jgi:hypothetical protein